MLKQILLPSEIASRRTAKFPRGETMTIVEVADVVGPEFKEMNENPPPEVVKVMRDIQKKGGARGPRQVGVPALLADLLPSERVALENKKARYVDQVASQKLKARFHEGPKGAKEFQAWKKKQPKEVQDDWDKYNEENKDKFKTAYLEPAQGEVVKHFLSHILAALRAQYLMYQTSHWQSKGPAYYGNHLLFQRLYESVQEEIDAVAEKLVGYSGIDCVDLPAQIELIEAYCSRWCRIECLHERGLQSEKDMQKLFQVSYATLKAQGSLPLGLDDLLMATANAHETNEYLLQQVLA